MASELKVAIVGCGPSGMVIAHACHQLGVDFIIYAPKRPSYISGAQYLHSDIGVRADGISPRTIKFVHRGVPWTYESKIYGRLPEGLETSWYKFQGEAEAWPLIDVYRWLWTQYSHKIVDGCISRGWLINLPQHYLTFNTAPLRHLMSGPGRIFWSENVQIVNGICFAEPDTIVYNGERDTPWYRSSNLWGHMSVEYPSHAWVPKEIAQYGLTVIEKPLYSKGVNLPGVILSGRYGRWQKGVLVDESYHQAIAEIRSRL